LVIDVRAIGWAGVIACGGIMSLDKSMTARSTSGNNDMQHVVENP
jgi:hypothetical protein